MGGVIIYSFLIAGGICLLAVSLFMWLNSNNSSVDDNAYDRSFKPEALVSKYKVNTKSDMDTFDAKSMNKYAAKKANTAKAVSDEKTPESSSSTTETLEHDKGHDKEHNEEEETDKKEEKAEALESDEEVKSS